jgi:hypothetical protein
MLTIELYSPLKYAIYEYVQPEETNTCTIFHENGRFPKRKSSLQEA